MIKYLSLLLMQLVLMSQILIWWLCMPTGSDAKAPQVEGINLAYYDNGISQLVNHCYSVNNMFAVRPALWMNKG